MALTTANLVGTFVSMPRLQELKKSARDFAQVSDMLVLTVLIVHVVRSMLINSN